MNKGLEALEHMNKNIIMCEDIDEDFDIIEKELKAFEIIKNSDYISIDTMLSQNYITRKEYDLLKEVLKNE